MIIERQSIGRREEQQDSYFSASRDGVVFAVVADGLGGMQAGQAASRCIIREARILFNIEKPTLNTAERFLQKFKDNAQNAILEYNREMRVEARSTVVALLTIADKAFIMHSGDSRCYRFLKDRFLSRTKDHSIPQLLFEQGKIADEEIGTHPDQGKLFNCLGGARGNDCEIESCTMAPGEWFLLCSDGFWEHLSVEELSSLYLKMPSQADKLLDRAVRNGGDSCDNVTFISVYPSVNPLYSMLSALKRVSPINLIIAVLFALLFALLLLAIKPSNPTEKESPDPASYSAGAQGNPELPETASKGKGTQKPNSKNKKDRDFGGIGDPAKASHGQTPGAGGNANSATSQKPNDAGETENKTPRLPSQGDGAAGALSTKIKTDLKSEK